MAREESVNRVGLGVDLRGGQETITQLRTIRSEMQGISAAAGGIPKNIGGNAVSYVNPNQASLFEKDMNRQGQLFDDFQRDQTNSIKREVGTREREFIASEKRITNNQIKENERRTKAKSPVTSLEIDTTVSERARKAAVKEAADRKDIQFERERAGSIKRIDDEALQERRRTYEKRREMAKQYSTYEGIENADFTTQRFKLRKFRGSNQPDSVKESREELALNLVAQRQRQQGIERDNRARQADEEKQARIEAGRNRQRDPRGRFLSNNALEVRSQRDNAKEVQRQREQLSAQEAEARRSENLNRIRENRKQRELVAKENERVAGDTGPLRDFRKLETQKSFDAEQRRRELEFDNSRATTKRQARASSVFQDSITQRDSLQKFVGGITDGAVKKDANDLFVKFNKIGNEAKGLRSELASPGRSRLLREIEADLERVEKEQREVIAGFRSLKAASLESQGLTGRPTSSRRGPGGGGAGPNLRDPQGLINERGFFTSGDALGRITRNILLYEAVSLASYGLITYIGNSIQAAKKTVEFSNALRFATEQAHGNLAANEQLSESLRPLGLSRQQSRAAVTEAARFTESRPEDINKLTTIAADIAAERGGGIDRTDELIEQLRRRESKFYKRIFGKTVESIYEDEATSVISKRAQTPSSLFVGTSQEFGRDFKTQSQQIKEYVAAMDDAQKENAVLNYTLAQGGRFQGEAAERAQTLAGKLDLVAAAFLNAQEGIGLFITDIKPLADLIGNLAGKVGVFDSLRAPALGRTGASGTISDYDINRFATDKTTGPRANALENINNYGGGALALGSLAVFAGLIGRKKATEKFRLSEYNKLFDIAQQKFGENIVAAQNEAILGAKDKKAGLVRSVGAGLNTITIGMTDRIKDLASGAAASLKSPERISAIRGEGYIPGKNSSYPGQIYNPVLGAFSSLDAASKASSREEKRLALGEKIQTGTAIAGGLVGGVLGFEVGSFIAKSINAGPIVATTLTILGSVAGTALGTTIGSTIGGAASSYLTSSGGVIAAAAAAGIGAVGVVAIMAALPLFAIAQIATSASDAQSSLRREEVISGAYAKQSKERQQAVQEERVRYRSLRPGEFTELLTKRDIIARGDLEGNGRGGLRNYREEIIPARDGLKGRDKQYADYIAAREKLLNDPDTSLDVPTSSRTGFISTERQRQLNALEAKDDADARDNTSNPQVTAKNEEYRKSNEERERRRVEKEERERDKVDRARQERVNEQGNALSKLRDASQGSLRVIEGIGTSLAGPENNFIRPLADQATAAERMRQQWGFLGEGAVDYFTKLEQGAAGVQLMRLQFNSLTASMRLNTQASKERDERVGPGQSRVQGEGQSIAQALADSIGESGRSALRERELTNSAFFEDDFREAFLERPGVKRNEAEQRADELRTFYRKKEEEAAQALFAREQITKIDRDVDYIGRRFDATPEALQEIKSRATEEQLSGLSARQIRSDPELRAKALENAQSRREIASRRVEEEIAKAAFTARDDARLRDDLRNIEVKKNQLLFEASNTSGRTQNEINRAARDIGQEYDRSVISRTDGIAQKDLTFDQFEARQNALKQEARRTVEQEAEARAAIKKGLEYQEAMNGELRIIREAIVGGNFSMLLQVQNDTQARIDQTSLQEGNPNFRVALDQSETKANPYSGYTRRGRKTY